MPLELREPARPTAESSTVDATRRRRRVRYTLIALITAWIALPLAAIPFYRLYDLRIYHNAIQAWLGGADLYAYYQGNLKLGFTYPPFGAFFLTPLTAWPMWISGILTTTAGIVSLLACVYFVLAPYAQKRGWNVWTLVLGVGLIAAFVEPVRQTLGYGQINLVLAAFVLADMAGIRSGNKWAGVGIGLATAVKLTPGLFIVYLLVARQWRAAAVACATTLAAWGLAFLAAPQSSATYFGNVLWNSGRIGRADFTPNQSLGGLLARLYDRTSTPQLLWVAFGLVVLALGLTRALAAHRAGDEAAAFTLVGLTANVVSPISWSHHLVWVVPAVLVMGVVGVERRSRGVLFWAVGTYLLFVVSPIWFYSPWSSTHWGDGAMRVICENSFAVGLIVLVAGMPFSVPFLRGRVPRARVG
ncbi:membrane protein [Actinorhabdospora filicis]|uniref:Membrane protein n=1 Tax=Actinorhabdospora filicis TaxID=1785913 RepID=A0A9W6SPP1_9ACTN|nr:glycosyltransferase 87 family protein [Actinorhabdospora filicis]GLZ79734.1 membrane protein [Actinorhabdospora filicis]